MKPLSEQRVKEIKEHFSFFDRDGNGKIDLDEFSELLKTLSPDSGSKQAHLGFDLIDTDGNGYIEFDEFLTWWKTCWWEY